MAMQGSSIPSQYVLLLVDLAVERGCSIDSICCGTQLTLPSLSQLGARVDTGEVDRLTMNVLAHTSDPLIGLALGQRLNLSAHAVIGQAFLTCSNLAEALDLLDRYGALLVGTRIQLMRTPNSAADYDGMIVVLDQTEPMKRFNYEVIFSAIQKTLSDLLGSAVPNIKVSFPFPAPADLAPFTRIFGEQIFFDTAQAEFSLPRDITRLTLPSSNRTLRELYESECARLLASLSDSASLTEQTLALIDKLEGQYPQLEQVASMLNMSTRTFRRRLKSEAASFQSLLNDVRVKHARRYLQDTNLSVETIAVSLGFNDASNFRRAFIQWTGQSPAEWRRASLADNPKKL
tara:strand:+ start:673 stop:1710 length:1038 start_codon:yes stop_codon:yes gene_type:complete